MILLDTYSLIQLVAEQEQLDKAIFKLLENNAGKIFVSAIVAYEIGLLYNKKLLELPHTPDLWYEKALVLHGLSELPITGKIALLASQLPQLHDDFIDRIIIATAMTHNLKLITPNKNIQKYPNLDWIC